MRKHCKLRGMSVLIHFYRFIMNLASETEVAKKIMLKGVMTRSFPLCGYENLHNHLQDTLAYLPS